MIKRLVALLMLVALTAVAWLLMYPNHPQIVTSHGDYPLYASIEAIAGRADAIVIGYVQGTAVRQDGATNLVVTDATVKVVENLKGWGVTEVITVQQMGGTIGSVTYREEGSVPYARGQKLLLALARLQNGHYMPLNPMQGALLVQPDGTVSFDGKSYPLTAVAEWMRNAPDTRTAAQKRGVGE